MTHIIKPDGRTLAEFSPLNPAEQTLLTACKQGKLSVVSPTLPEVASADIIVRATFLRFLALGGDELAPVHENGVQLKGAWIEGDLCVISSKVPSNLIVIDCNFNTPLLFHGARISGSLNFSGSHLPSFSGNGLTCEGNLSFQRSYATSGGIQVVGAKVGGNFDCSGATIIHSNGFSLWAERAVIGGHVLLRNGFTATGEVRLRDAQIAGNLEFDGAKLDGKDGYALVAEQAAIAGGVFFRNGFTAEKGVQLLGAQIGGSLEFDGAKLDGRDGYALWAERAVIGGPVFLRNGFSATGEVRLRDVHIGGNLECDGAKLDGKDGYALIAEQAVIKGCVYLRYGFTAEKSVRLSGSQIGGNLECDGAKLDGKDGYALIAEQAVIKGCVYLRNGFTAEMSVRLSGAQIGGNVECHGAKLDGKDGFALMLDRAMINGHVLLCDGFAATTEVQLAGAQIGGNLNCDGAKLDSKSGYALMAEQASIAGGIFLRKGFIAEKGVQLLGAQIGGNLECDGATLHGKDSYALWVERAVIGGSVFLRNGFASLGQVRIPNTQIGGDFECVGAKLDGGDGYALTAWGMVIKGAFIFRDLNTPVSGVILMAAHVNTLVDAKDSWGEKLNLDGFTYDSFGGNAPTDADTRIAWLDKQNRPHSGLSGNGSDFKPQPWRKLSQVLKGMGHTEDARQVAIAFENRLRTANLIGQTPKHWGRFRAWFYREPSRLLHWLFRVLVGYGYRPLRLLNWMLVVWLICSVFYWHAALQGVFSPTSLPVLQNQEFAICRPDYIAPTTRNKKIKSGISTPQVTNNWYLCEKLHKTYPGFNPLAFSLDLLIPPLDLQQKKNWTPLVQTPNSVWYQELEVFDLKHVTRLVLWFEILFGWASSLLLVAVLSGLTKRREE